MSDIKDSALPRTEMDALLLGRLDELTVNEPSHRGRNILSIILSIIVLLLISSLIVAAIVIINPEITNLSPNEQKVREAITLEEALLGELSPNDFNSHWLPPGDRNIESVDHLMYEDAKTLYLVTLPHGQQSNFTSSRQTADPFKPNVTVLVSNSSLLASIDYQGAKLSPSKRYLLIWTSRKRQYRHSFTAKYFLYDIKLDLISLLSTKPQEQLATGKAASSNQSSSIHNRYEDLDTASLYLYDQSSFTHDDDFIRFQLVEWYSSNAKEQDLDGSVDSLILVQNNDIYTLPNVAALSSSANVQSDSQPSVPIRLTYSGKANEISNAVPDWLYEEEILADAPAFQVSPSSNYLAYLSFNDSLVGLMPYSIYGEQILPRVERIRYPKAGQPNPFVSVHVIENFAEITNHQNIGYFPEVRDIELSLPSELEAQQHYINRITWLTSDKLAVFWSNRNQNESFVLICSKIVSNSPWTCMKNLHLQSTNGWLDIGDDLFALDKDYYLALLPKFQGSEVGNFKHIAKVSIHRPNNLVYLTDGHKDVISINGIDREKSLCYYTSTVVGEPGQRQMFVASMDAPTVEAERNIGQPTSQVEVSGPSVCITCSHHPRSCLYNSIKMSASTKHYIFQCDGPDVPRTELRTTKNFRFEPVASSRRSNISALPVVSNSVDRLANNEIDKPPVHDDSLLWTVEDNLDLRNKLENTKAMPLTVRLKIPIQNTSYMADVLLLLPPQIGPTTNFRTTSSLAAAHSRQSQAPPQSNHASTRPRREINQQQTTGTRESPITKNQPANKSQQSPFEHLDYESIKEYSSQVSFGQLYPMVVDVYGGPGSQKVDYRFHMHFGHYLASNRRTVYAMIDGRGSGHQGSKRLYELYHKLGTVEIQDQIDTTAQLTKMLPFVDATKVAIWGWSYGGYAAAMSLAQSNARAIQSRIRLFEKQPELFASTSSPLQSAVASRSDAHTHSRPKFQAQLAQSALSLPYLRSVFECAASVAPVTNWIYYDTAYTEKYMSSPWTNELFDELISRDHLLRNKQNLSLVARQQYIRNQQKAQTMALNRWTRLDPSSGSINNAIGRPSQSDLMDLLARSANLSQQPHSNATSRQTAANGPKPNAANLSRSPMYNELNERYRKASLIDQIGNIDRKRFLLIHGTADDNVHFQQSIMLMKQLIKKNILFETRLYPDQDHSIANRADKLHLGSTLSNFFAECFDMAY